MPMVNSIELAKIGSTYSGLKKKAENAALKAKEAKLVNKAAVVVSAVGGGLTAGYVRGKYEDQTTGAWNIPHTSLDIELMAFFALTAAALGSALYKPIEPYTVFLAGAAGGVGGHYAGQIGRKAAKTGNWKGQIAGVPGVGELPQWDPTSYNPTQYSGAYDDPVAAALSSSGV